MWSKPVRWQQPLNRPDLQATAAGILVTGATGFVGRHIVSALLSHGFAVTALIRPEMANLADALDPRLPDVCIQIPMAITDAQGLASIVANCDAVIYAAGSVRGGRLRDFETANEAGLKAVMDAMNHADVNVPLLLMSSLAASRPELSNYSQSKFNGEQCLSAHTELAWTIFRPPAIYGPGDKEMLPVLKMAAKGWLFNPGPADQSVSLLHVEDLARAVLAWLKAPLACTHQIYAFDDGTSGGYGWSALAQAVGAQNVRVVKVPRLLLNGVARLNLICSSLFSYAPMLTPGKVRELTHDRWVCEDNARFELATGWRPTIDLRTGWQRLMSFQKNTKSG